MILLQLLFFASYGFAQSMTDGVLIKNADSMFSDQVKQTVRLEGHVQVAFQNQILTCDSAQIDMDNQTIEANGHVILETLKVHLEGTKLRFNYKTNTGIFYDGFVKSGQVVFEGDVIEKTGPDSYIAQNAEYTACETCPPGWAFSGKTIEAEIGGYAYIKRPIFRIAGIPVFTFWAMMVPLKSTRQSGFLIPELNFTPLGGAALGESYFWAINKSSDLTLTPINYALRGLKGHESYRYVLSPDSKGSLDAAFLQDRALAAEYSVGSSYVNRYFMHYQHQLSLPDGWVSRIDLMPVSDLRYPRDFPEELLGDGDPSLENRVSISKDTETTSFTTEATLNTNLLKYYPLTDNSDAVHKLPEIRYSGRERRIGGESGPLFRWDVDYVDFTRDQFSYDNLQHDPRANNNGYLQGVLDPTSHAYIRTGIFNPATDLLRTGQRLDISPTLSYPFHLFNRFDILPSVTYHEMQYRFDAPAEAQADGYDDTAARRYIQTDISAKTEFSAIYGDLSDDKGSRWKHSFIPELSYSSIPWMRSPNNPFFGNYTGLPYYTMYNPVSDADIIGPNKLQFDYDDRVYARQLTTASFTNELVRKKWVNGEAQYERAILFTVSQSYDFAQENGGLYPPWSPINGFLQAHFDHFDTYTTAQYNTYANVSNVNATVKGMVNDANYLQLSYNHNYLFDNYSMVIPGSEIEVYGVGLGYTSRYVDAVGSVNWSPRVAPTGIQYFQGDLSLKPPGNCWHLKLTAAQFLGGQVAFRFNFAFDFSGGGPKDPNSTNATQI